MNDVESINVLQGSGAAALYGSQASNGAVLITTKKGKAGVTDINVSHNVQITEVAFFPKIQTGFGSGGSAYGIDPAGNAVFNYLENQSYGQPFDGSLRPLGPKLEDGTQLYTTYDFKPGHDDFWEKGVTNQTDFSVQSGNDRSTIYVSGQYVTVTGTTPGDKYTRGNVRLNGTTKIGKKIEVQYATTVAPNHYDITSATGTIYSNMLNMPSNVDITAFRNWRKDKFADPNGFYNPWYLNPYYTADANRQTVDNTYITGSVQLKFTPVNGLDLIARQGISLRNSETKWTTEGYDYSEYAINTDQSSKADIPYAVSEESFSSSQSITDLLAQYDKTIGDINLNLVAGAQFTSNSTYTLGVTANNLTIPGLYNVSNGTGTPGVGQASFQARQVGVYGKLTVGYKDFLFLTATGRNDWDSRLSKANQSFFYPSAELSFVVTDAFSSLKNNVIDFIKLRGGVSQVGQVNLGNTTTLGAYSLLPTFFPIGTTYFTTGGYSQGNLLVSNDLKPELTNQWELGADFTLLTEKISGSVTYFSSRTSNQTIGTSLSSSTGFTGLLTNVGETSSKGVELTLHYTPIRTDNWTVTVGGNYTALDNKVESISADLPQLTLTTSGSALSVAKENMPFPVIMGLDYQRDPQGRVIVDGVTGIPLSPKNENVFLGNANPKDRLGLDAQISWKGVHFSILFEYRGGYYIYNGIGPEMDWSGTSARTAYYNRQSFIYPNSVYMDGDSYVPNTSVAIANGNGNSGFWSDGINRSTTSNYVSKGDFWKLREIAISYDIPASLLRSSKVIKRATISAQGRNLFLWLPKDNIYTDPEYSVSNSSNGVGLNSLNQTPPVRNYGATLSLTF
jgi:TonB-linked SusC/RagA family outer membrane protein